MAELSLRHETVHESPKVVTVCIAGELDETNGRQAETYFNDLIDSEKPQHVLLDLAGLSFAGSGFFSSLLFWKEEVAKSGGQLVLFGMRPELASTMRIFSVDRLVAICDNQQAALDKVAGA
jgi:anti-anti-sigma factor